MVIKTATPRFRNNLLSNSKSLMPAARPIPIMGPINGEINIAPMIIAVELTINPTEATEIAKVKI